MTTAVPLPPDLVGVDSTSPEIQASLDRILDAVTGTPYGDHPGSTLDAALAAFGADGGTLSPWFWLATAAVAVYGVKVLGSLGFTAHDRVVKSRDVNRRERLRRLDVAETNAATRAKAEQRQQDKLAAPVNLDTEGDF